MWVANDEKNIDMTAFDGIEELLEKLEKKGSTLGVVTSRTREELELVLDQLPIRKYFSICICADDTKEHKPSAQPLLKYMELSGARKKKPSISETALQIWHAPSMREWIVFMRYGANRKQKRMRLIAPGNRNNLRKYFYKNCLTEPAF